MRHVLNDILYYVTLVVFWIVFPAAFVICFGFDIGLIIILCLAAIVMDIIAMIVGEDRLAPFSDYEIVGSRWVDEKKDSK